MSCGPFILFHDVKVNYLNVMAKKRATVRKTMKICQTFTNMLGCSSVMGMTQSPYVTNFCCIQQIPK